MRLPLLSPRKERLLITRRIDIDFSHKCGKIKPVNGMLGMPVYDPCVSFSLTDVYGELSAPAVLFSSRDGEGTIPLDLHEIFPDPSLDERFVGSYNFEELDRALSDMKSIGAEIVLRLGESPLPIGKRHYLRTPMPYERMAYILSRVIAHCNQGFAGGFKLGIKRVEIWQSPDDSYGFFSSPEEYFELYKTVSLEIKKYFPRIKVGAYSAGGFASLNHFGLSEKEKNYVSYLESFLSYIMKSDPRPPLDFLSWKCGPESPEELILHSSYARSYLNHYGFKKTESIVSAFLPTVGEKYSEYQDKRYPALLAACLIGAAKSDISMMFYSDTHPLSPRNALYSLDDRRTLHRYAPYNVMRAFGQLAKGAFLVDATEDYRREIYSLSAVTENDGRVIIATRDYEGILEINPSGHSFGHYDIEGILGGGERGRGFTTGAKDVPFGRSIKLRVGKNEVYVLTLRP